MKDPISNNMALMIAIKDNNLGKVIEAVNAGAKVNAEIDGLTPLVLAIISNKSLEIIEFLIAKGANVSVEIDGHTPIMLAVICNASLEVIKLLEQARKRALEQARKWKNEHTIPLGGIPEEERGGISL